MQQERVSTAGMQPTPPPAPLINLPSLSEDDTNTGLPPILRPRRRRRWIILIGLILLVLLLGALIVRASSQGPKVTYQTGHLTQGNLTITVNATGPIQSGTYNLIFSGTGGKIDEIDVSVGQKVTKGQVLAHLDPTALQDAVDQAQTTVDNARASLNAAVASANSSSGNSNTSVSAAQTAVSGTKASATQVANQGQASVNTAQTALTNAQTALTNAQQELQSAVTTYNSTTSTTPTTTTCPPLSASDTLTNTSNLSAACLTA